MDLELYDKSCRLEEIIKLVDIYKESFRLYSYSNASVWRKIKKRYDQDWDLLLYESMQLDKDANRLRLFIQNNLIKLNHGRK